MFRVLTLILSVATAATLAQSTFAADMIEGYRAPPSKKYVTHQRQRVYVSQVFDECEAVLIEYRPPYHPHSEIVQICHPEGRATWLN